MSLVEATFNAPTTHINLGRRFESCRVLLRICGPVWDLKVVPVSNDHGLDKANLTALHCRHCQFLVGANSHGNFLVVSIGPSGEVGSPRESHSRQHAPRCPTFASDSPEIYRVESFSNRPPAEPSAIYICWAREWLRWLERSHLAQNRSLTARVLKRGRQ